MHFVELVGGYPGFDGGPKPQMINLDLVTKVEFLPGQARLVIPGSELFLVTRPDQITKLREAMHIGQKL